MKRYHVELVRHLPSYFDSEYEAESEDEAIEMAMNEIREMGRDTSCWEVSFCDECNGEPIAYENEGSR